MKNKTNKFLFLTITLFILTALSNPIAAQDATEVDPDHYKVEFENDDVRVLRITYDTGDKSVMHSHPEGVVVFLTDGKGKFTFPDNTTSEESFKPGLVIWTEATTHQPENTGNKPFEIIQIEMKK